MAPTANPEGGFGGDVASTRSVIFNRATAIAESMNSASFGERANVVLPPSKVNSDFPSTRSVSLSLSPRSDQHA
jgi:hypothetical protein